VKFFQLDFEVSEEESKKSGAESSVLKFVRLLTAVYPEEGKENKGEDEDEPQLEFEGHQFMDGKQEKMKERKKERIKRKEEAEAKQTLKEIMPRKRISGWRSPFL
jgi:hypothetical protein